MTSAITTTSIARRRQIRGLEAPGLHVEPVGVARVRRRPRRHLDALHGEAALARRDQQEAAGAADLEQPAAGRNQVEQAVRVGDALRRLLEVVRIGGVLVVDRRRVTAAAGVTRPQSTQRTIAAHQPPLAVRDAVALGRAARPAPSTEPPKCGTQRCPPHSMQAGGIAGGAMAARDSLVADIDRDLGGDAGDAIAQQARLLSEDGADAIRKLPTLRARPAGRPPPAAGSAGSPRFAPVGRPDGA